MIDRSLRNDDIVGAKPKSFTSKKQEIKQIQSQVLSYPYPTYVSSIKNNPIGGSPNSRLQKNPEKPYVFVNNIYGIDLNQVKTKEAQTNNEAIRDSLDKFESEFQNKSKKAFPKLNMDTNPIENQENKDFKKNIAKFYGITPGMTPSSSFYFEKNFQNLGSSANDSEVKLREALLRELVKNDKSLEKNLNGFFGVDDSVKNPNQAGKSMRIETSPSRNMQETNYSQFLKIQREMDDIKSRLKKGKFNPLTGEKY